MTTIKKTEIRTFIKDNYVSYIYDNGEVVLQENYEQMNYRDIIKLINQDVEALCRFLNWQGIILK